ncbi:MAG TPA: FxLYD domain-containing protein [Spirochaetia bacterium]|nr:FxLYD domain-containing protein [Spirochaetia bacterium]
MAKHHTVGALVMAVGMIATAPPQCRFIETEPPFQYLSVVLVAGEVADYHRLLGIHYSLRNTSAKTISSLRISFRLYDESGNQLPSPGDNYFVLTHSGWILPQTDCEVCASLDSSFFFAPTGTLVVDGFRIYRIDFTDGSQWSDPFNLYGYPNSVDYEDLSKGGNEP